MTGERSLKSSLQADLDAFHSGFHACAKEVLQYLNKVENWTAREQMCTRLINHLHKVSAQFQLGAGILQRPLPGDDAPERDAQRDTQANCVPVIQRTQNLELNENDTDTDSGYGGEAEKGDGKCEKRCDTAKGVKIKQEFGDERVTKKAKMNWSANGVSDSTNTRPDVALMNSLMGMAGVGGQQTPFCMPFYFINPSAAASYMPLFDKSHLEKLVYPFPWLYPGIPTHAAAAAAAIAFPNAPTDKTSGFNAASLKDDEPLSPDGDLSDEADLASPVSGDHYGSEIDAIHQPQRNENVGT